MQGWRVTMEDSHATILDLKQFANKKSIGSESGGASGSASGSVPDEKVSFFAVYDGHGGDRVALFSGENVHKIIARQATFDRGEYGQAIKDGFLSTDRAILEEGNVDSSGCAATSAIVTDKSIIVGNAGDSRTVLGVKGIAKPLSFDHKPQNEGEKARICAAGGYVDVGRVNGNLALSRAIGDFDFKKSADLPPEEQVVTAYPDVLEHEITPDDEFLILACDGIWDCMHSQQVVEFVRRGIAAKQPLELICENLMDNCLAPETDMTGIGCDNMTVMIIALLNGQTKEEWYETVAGRVARGEGPVAPVSSAEIKGNPFSNSHSNNGRSTDNEYGSGSGGRAGSAGGSSLSSLALQQLMGQVLPNGSYVIQSDNSNASSLFANMGLSLTEEEDDDDDEETGGSRSKGHIQELDDDDEDDEDDKIDADDDDDHELASHNSKVVEVEDD
ncbi:type 2C protein phosphatase PTC2 [Sugiyamaella lignohabitans]|uniref:protein-serine/threonine phosphatase n=1 Tax=Sugiyamaella lignohabitans TaxID=796027 RepID=A0A167DF76_9ASCO|nr:type 2C protein phosphatase PTC2 [Sugiyamaella lignohabitans]ANB12850.1 type 2C protein phosphatase PTC2 [Sugiyamaella lignohabitans]